MAATKGNSAKIGTKGNSAKIGPTANSPKSSGKFFSANVRDFKVNPVHAHLFQIDPTNGKISVTPRRFLMIPPNQAVRVGPDFNANFGPDPIDSYEKCGPIDMVNKMD